MHVPYFIYDFCFKQFFHISNERSLVPFSVSLAAVLQISTRSIKALADSMNMMRPIFKFELCPSITALKPNAANFCRNAKSKEHNQIIVKIDVNSQRLKIKTKQFPIRFIVLL